MPHRKTQHSEPESAVPSKDLPGFPPSFAPVFIRNQFFTKIELPDATSWPSAKGLTAIVTGSNSGLGLEASRQLLTLGLSHLILAVRSAEKGKDALMKLQPANPSATIDVWLLDMESYESIQAFTKKCEAELPRIDIVILNAGVSARQFATSQNTGHEKTVQVNHFGTALLAILLLPILTKKSLSQEHPPHLTVVNSAMAHLCKVPNKSERPFLASFDDISILPFDEQERYGASKLLSQLFLVKLSSFVRPENVIINMVDPGLTKGTGLFDIPGFVGVIGRGAMSMVGRPVERGAATYVDAVMRHGKESHGCFLMNCKIAPLSRWYYSDGQELTEAIWTETLADPHFANFEAITAFLG